jgi:hypothetical protein
MNIDISHCIASETRRHEKEKERKRERERKYKNVRK